MAKRNATKYEQQAEQYYREPRFAAEQIFENLDLGNSIIWDPFCGSGNILNVARDRGFDCFGSDIIDRHERDPAHDFRRIDFRKCRELPFLTEIDQKVSIIGNPPYGKVDGVENMGEEMIKHARKHFRDRVYRMVFILPIEFSCGIERYFDIYERDRPSHELVYCQRPSMPRGDTVEQLGDKAFKGGMADYSALVWTAGGPHRCEKIFMRPHSRGRPPVIERRLR